jgi:hypothetical protein
MAEETSLNADVIGALGNKVGGKVAHLLAAIEKEPVPDRLMELALELQKALNEKLDQPSKE